MAISRCFLRRKYFSGDRVRLNNISRKTFSCLLHTIENPNLARPQLRSPHTLITRFCAPRINDKSSRDRASGGSQYVPSPPAGKHKTDSRPVDEFRARDVLCCTVNQLLHQRRRGSKYRELQQRHRAPCATAKHRPSTRESAQGSQNPRHGSAKAGVRGAHAL